MYLRREKEDKMSATDYISLIYKDLAKEISPDEKLLLEVWMNADVDNRLLVEQLKLIWDNAGADELGLSLIDVDLDVEFNFLQERLEAEERDVKTFIHDKISQEKTKMVKMNPRFWGIAAGFALLIGSIWFFSSQYSKDQDFAEIQTGNEAKEILLADGTRIYMNVNSSLKYPTTFNGEIREVEFSGEAFFEVAKDAQHPFIIRTPYEEVTVLGTSFNVRAYESEASSEIAVCTGSVKVHSGVTSSILEPNEKVIVDHSSRVMGVEKTESLNELAWHTKSIKFNNTPLSAVFSDLEDFYHVTIKVANANILNCPYTDSFGENDNFDMAIQSIATVFGISVKKEDETHFTLVGGSCQ